MSAPEKTRVTGRLTRGPEENGLVEIRLSLLASASDVEKIVNALEAIMALLPPLDSTQIKGLKGKLPKDKRYEITVSRPSDGSQLNEDDKELFSSDEVFPNSHPGSRLRGLRTREGITQKQMAEALDIPPRHISEMENGKRTISLEMAKRIDATFNISYKVFL